GANGGGHDHIDGEAGDARAGGHLHDAQVNDLLESKTLTDPDVFADSVEDDDRVMDREANHREQGGHEEGIDLSDPEVEHLAQDRKYAGQDEDVVQQCEEGRTAELKACAPSTGHVVKPPGEECQDGDRRGHHGEQRKQNRVAIETMPGMMMIKESAKKRLRRPMMLSRRTRGSGTGCAAAPASGCAAAPPSGAMSAPCSSALTSDTSDTVYSE